MMKQTRSIAEVTESSTRRVVAQCTQRKDRPPIALPPPYGSLVRIEGDPETIAVVSAIATTGYDPNRPASALGLASYEEAHEEYPELSELLLTHIELIPVGYTASDRFIQGTPPSPPPLHAGVRIFESQNLDSFLERLYFLRLLYDNGSGSEELLVQTILFLLDRAEDESQKQSWLLRMGRELARLLKDDYDQLKYILERIEG